MNGMYEKNLKNYVYVCPQCFNKMEECSCRSYPFTLVQLDRNIWPTVKVLNEKGYFTENCCEGHIGSNEMIYILFKKLYRIKTPFPKGFEGNSSGLKAIISGSSEQTKKRNKRKLLNSLYEWAYNLEPRIRNIGAWEIVCPECGTAQRSDRTECLSCGRNFEI